MSELEDSREELDRFYSQGDPWGYDDNPDDEVRRVNLLREMSRFSIGRVLDIGCGNGFLSGSFPAKEVFGVDLSEKAIAVASQRVTRPGVHFQRAALEELPGLELDPFDCIVITGVLYPHYIGHSLLLVYRIIDDLLKSGGVLFSVHIEEWYEARFPMILTRRQRYPYRDYHHVMETYIK